MVTSNTAQIKVSRCQAPDCAIKENYPFFNYFKRYNLIYHLVVIHLKHSVSIYNFEHLKAVNLYICSYVRTLAAGWSFSNSVSYSVKLLAPAIH